MDWYKNILSKLKEKMFSPQEDKGSEESQEIEEQDTRTILKDANGEDLICKLCDNQDNETRKYFPIREGDKRKFHGDVWHKGCLRVFMKAARRGDLG